MNSQITSGDQRGELVVAESENLVPVTSWMAKARAAAPQGEQAPRGADVGGEGHQPGDRAGVVALAARHGLRPTGGGAIRVAAPGPARAGRASTRVRRPERPVVAASGAGSG